MDSGNQGADVASDVMSRVRAARATERPRKSKGRKALHEPAGDAAQARNVVQYSKAPSGTIFITDQEIQSSLKDLYAATRLQVSLAITPLFVPSGTSVTWKAR